jgi:nucleoside-diphosphate-sugar epimerase
MRVAIAGGHGKIALMLTRRLAARGDAVISLIRNPSHGEEIRAIGGEPVVCDLETASPDELAAAIVGSDVVVSAAGAGPGSGPERKLTVDRDGAIKLLDAATTTDVRRYLMISSVGAENPPDDDDVFSVYLRAKADADRALQDSDRDWTIVRPGPLTDERGTGHVNLSLEPRRGQVPREDVAAVLDELAHGPLAVRLVLYLNSGEDPIDRALAAVSA